MMKSGLLIICFAFLFTVKGQAFTSADITAKTVEALPSCLHYKVKGFCVWMSPITGMTTTPYLEHYSPDVVLSVFDKAGDNPWTEINATLDKAGSTLQQTEISAVTHFKAGSGQQSFLNQHDSSLYFKEADVIGNPGLLAMPDGVFLPSTAIPLNPYFQSMTDSILWRGLTPASLPEEAATFLTDLQYHVGKSPINWGSIYPHQGSLVGVDDAVVAEVIALRATHLTTLPISQRFGHLVATLPLTCGEVCDASPVTVNSDVTQFQRIYPNPETSCHILGSSINEADGLSAQTKGAYTWIVWRKYEGCIDGDGDLVQKVIF